MIGNVRQEVGNLLVATLLVGANIIDHTIGCMYPRTTQGIETEVFLECCPFDNFRAGIEKTAYICGDDAKV